MKKLLLFILIHCFALQGYSQYKPMLSNGAEWYYCNNFEQTYWNQSVKIGGDSIILLDTYKELEFINHNGPSSFKIELLREDTTQKKVYIYDRDLQVEKELYNFSLQVGDTFFYDEYTLILDSISNSSNYNPGDGYRNPFIFDTSLLVYYFNSPLPNVGLPIIVWIESIGNVTELIHPQGSTTVEPLGLLYLLCHFNNFVIKDYLYIPWAFSLEPNNVENITKDCEIITSVGKNIISLNNYTVYPNPIYSDVISIEGKDILEIKIYNQLGFLLAHEKVFNIRQK